MGVPGHTLWVFTEACLTLYRVVKSHSRQELQQTLGSDFPGVLVSDCLSIYDEATALQQKCYSHHLKAVSKAIERHPQGGSGFLMEVKLLLKTAMSLKPLKAETQSELYQQWTDRLLP